MEMKKITDKKFKISINSQINNLSKNDIIKKINSIKTTRSQYEKEIFKNKYNMNNNNLIPKKQNLTSINFFNSSSYYDNISKNKVKIPIKTLKHELTFDSSYSSFISKRSKKSNKGFPMTGLDLIVSPQKGSSYREFKYKKYFSDKRKYKNNYIDYNMTKPSTRQNTKTNIFNNDSSSKKNSLLIVENHPNKSNIYINYNRYIFNDVLTTNTSNRYNLTRNTFIEKCRTIWKEKIMNKNLDNEYKSLIEVNEEQIKLLNQSKEEYMKNISLLDIMFKTFNKYLKKLENEKNDELKMYNQLFEKKMNLENYIENTQNRINFLKIEKTKFENFQNFLITVKNRINKDNQPEGNTASSNADTKIDTKKPSKSNRRKSLLIKEDTSKSMNKKLKILKLFSLNKKKRNSISYNNQNEKDQILKKMNTISDNNISKISSNEINNNLHFGNEEELKKMFELFTVVENNILNKIEIYNSQRLIIINLQNKLDKTKSNHNIEYLYDNMIIESKIKMLEFIKKERQQLKNKLDLTIKTISKKNNYKNLEKKIYNILVMINKELNLQKNFEMKNLFNLLKLEPDEFYNKKKISKELYMLKIIDNKLLFLIDSKNKYKNNPKSNTLYRNVYNSIIKENNLKYRLLNTELLKQKNLDKKLKIIENSTKIHFIPNLKYIPSNKKYKKNTSKIIIKSNSIDQWFSFD